MTKLRTISDVEKEFEAKFEDCGHNICPCGKPLATKKELYFFLSTSLRTLIEQVVIEKEANQNVSEYYSGFNACRQKIKEIINEILK